MVRATDWLVGLALVSPLVVDRQGQSCVCISAAGAQSAPQPAVAHEGDALMFLMHLAPLLETCPLAHSHRVPLLNGKEGPGRVTFCFVSVMARPLTCWPGGCAGTPIQAAARAVTILPLPAAREGCLTRAGAKLPAPSDSCSAHTWVLWDGAGDGTVPHPPGRVCSSWVSP